MNKKNRLIACLLIGILFIAGCQTGQVVRKGCRDRDRDGYFGQAGCGTTLDCNDNNAAIYPGAAEICQNGVDDNCDGIDNACTTIATTTIGNTS